MRPKGAVFFADSRDRLPLAVETICVVQQEEDRSERGVLDSPTPNFGEAKM